MGSAQPRTSRASLMDQEPPLVFVCALEPSNTLRFGNDAQAFFGNGGVSSPAATVVMNASVAEADTALLTSLKLSVAPGSTTSLRFVAGYIPPDLSVTPKQLAQKYSALFSSGGVPLQQKVAGEWQKHLHRLELPPSPQSQALSAEVLWHSFYLQAAVSFDTFFGEDVADILDRWAGGCLRYYNIY